MEEELTPEQYQVCRMKGTEPPFTGKYYNSKEPGMYLCAACGNELFDSNTKFESGTGWPSFYKPISEENVETEEDTSYGMRRTEIMCRRCGAHLGHVFPDGPAHRPSLLHQFRRAEAGPQGQEVSRQTPALGRTYLKCSRSFSFSVQKYSNRSSSGIRLCRCVYVIRLLYALGSSIVTSISRWPHRCAEIARSSADRSYADGHTIEPTGIPES